MHRTQHSRSGSGVLIISFILHSLRIVPVRYRTKGTFIGKVVENNQKKNNGCQNTATNISKQKQIYFTSKRVQMNSLSLQKEKKKKSNGKDKKGGGKCKKKTPCKSSAALKNYIYKVDNTKNGKK